MSVLGGIDMNEVTRLTRSGRLGEAVALLRSGLLGRQPTERPPNDAVRPAAEILDPDPPDSPKGVWHVPGVRPPKTGAVEALMPPPAGARFETHTIANAAGRRDYKLYVPSHTPDRPLPLVVMLHGCTQSPDDFAAGTQMNAIAEEMGLLVAYPAQTKSANSSKCWNWFKPDDQNRGLGEPSIIADMTRQIMREHRVDPGRVFVAGLSAGGAAAAVLAHEYPDLYAGLCVHSGLACGAAKDLPSAFAAMRNGGRRTHKGPTPVRTIIFHGGADKIVSLINAGEIAGQFAPETGTIRTMENGRSAGGIAYTHTIDADAAGVAQLEQWTLHGVKHAWSGGSAKGSYTDPRGPDASREMMRFFLQPAARAHAKESRPA